MCGIAGKVILGEGKIEENDLRVMGEAIIHRGPDQSGSYLSPDKKVGFAFRRLAIIDLSPMGDQPMSYLNRYKIVFNGEIYNYNQEKEKLILAGYKFKSKSDTEVIMALYDKYGKECLEHLRGMFAFVIYDHKNKTIFCARDRVGKKPLKFYYDGKVFLFASELKSILTQSEYKREVDWTAIHHYLTLQYCPAPLTGFKNINKLEPGHYLSLNLETKEFVKKRYWKLDYSDKLTLSEDQWAKKILDSLEESVQLRMVADVPLGAFLSGGVDSSAVVALMSRNSMNPVKTFTVAFKEKKYDESRYAKIISERFHTDHTVFTASPEDIETLPLLVRHYEEPYADSSGLATYHISKLTSEHVTVALNGDGGDECFGGYGRYAIQKFALAYEKYRLFHNFFVGPAIELSLGTRNKNTFTNRVLKFSRSATDDYRRRYVDYIYYFDNQMKAEGYTDIFRKKYAIGDTYNLISDKYNEAGVENKMDQMFYSDFVTYLPDDLLTKVDIATMAVSLEGRSPFLDHQLVELSAKIDASFKIKGFNGKKNILKKALSGLVPDEVMYRPKKGFGVPLENWFRGNLKSYTKEILLSKRFENRCILKRSFVKNLIDKHMETNINYSPQLWSLLTLELWFREFFDK